MTLNLVRVTPCVALAAASLFSICACSGGGGGSGSIIPSYTIGGSVSGLQGTGLVLQDNLGNDLSVGNNGSFVFSAAIAAGSAYSVTVKTQPSNVWQTCATNNASGIVGAANVTNVTVACVTNIYSVGGAVNGLAGSGLVVENNGVEDISIAHAGPFTFPTLIASGKTYAVTVKTQPTVPNQTCAPSAASGTITNAAIATVAITCTTNTYTVGGTVTGLAGSGLVLQDNAGDDLAISSNGAFTFAAKVASGLNYAVTVKTQPGNPAQVCTVGSGSGAITNGNITNVAVSCTTPVVACGTPSGVVVQHASNVTADETWAGAGTTHLITASISVLAPATLTIQKCAIVKLKAGVQIVVHGGAGAGQKATLIAAGDDASVGAVYFTNADANQPWGSLVGFNANSLIQLNYAMISGGGATSAGTRNATIEMHGTSNTTLPDPVLTINTTIINQMQGTGIYLDNAAFTADSLFLAISDCPDYPIALSAMATGSIPSFVGEDNVHNEALVVGNANIFADLTIHNRLPIHFHTDGIQVSGGPPAFAPDITLTLDPGVVLKFEKASTAPPMITFGTGGQTHDQNAALIANGTSFQPVLFTSAAATPAPGDWAGIWLLTSNRSVLQNVVIEYAGGDAGIGPVNCGPFDPSINQQARHTAALLVGDGTDQQYIPPSNLITGSTFRNNTGNFAIDSVWENPTRVFGPSLHNDNTFTSTGKFCPQSKNLIPLGCTISGVDESGCEP
jgi:hypothetical protein